jgi:predicted nucleotidyltransferase
MARASGLTEIADRLRSDRAGLEQFHVHRLSLFGSMARGEATAASDIDLLVDFDQPIDLLRFIELEEYLSALLDGRVDLVLRESLKPLLRDRILREAVNVL